MIEMSKEELQAIANLIEKAYTLEGYECYGYYNSDGVMQTYNDGSSYLHFKIRFDGDSPFGSMPTKILNSPPQIDKIRSLVPVKIEKVVVSFLFDDYDEVEHYEESSSWFDVELHLKSRQ